MPLPPCGLYRTTRPLGDVPAGRLVSFHNHGEPGPGIYLPAGWDTNRARWHERGHTLPDEAWADSLVRLPDEGLYRVREDFFCCDNQCLRFTAGQLVQLGYDGAAEAILFVPEWTAKGLAFPSRGTRLDASRFGNLDALHVPLAPDAPRGLVH